MNQLNAELDNIHSSANEASDLIESEQLQKRELEDQMAEASVRLSELSTNSSSSLSINLTHIEECVIFFVV